VLSVISRKADESARKQWAEGLVQQNVPPQEALQWVCTSIIGHMEDRTVREYSDDIKQRVWNQILETRLKEVQNVRDQQQTSKETAQKIIDSLILTVTLQLSQEVF